MIEMMTQKRGLIVKVAVYLGDELAREVAYEAKRLDRSRIWVVMRCIRHALPQMRELPSLARVPITQRCEQEA
jgi:predicted transcriptional regulator